LLPVLIFDIFDVTNKDSMKLAIIIPAFNEEGSIEKVLKSIPKKLKGVDKVLPIVIDDGSIDNTYELAKNGSHYVAMHVINLGLGAALCTGFAAARKINCDIAVTLDGDGQHNPEDIQNLIDPIINKKADVVIGTRMTDTKGMPPIKIFGNWMMNVMTLLIFRKWSSDTQSGMRALSKLALQKLDLHSVGYEISSEIIGEAHRNRLRIKEVPIETIYTDYSNAKGQSVINAVNIFTRLLTIKMSGKKK